MLLGARRKSFNREKKRNDITTALKVERDSTPTLRSAKTQAREHTKELQVCVTSTEPVFQEKSQTISERLCRVQVAGHKHPPLRETRLEHVPVHLVEAELTLLPQDGQTVAQHLLRLGLEVRVLFEHLLVVLRAVNLDLLQVLHLRGGV